MSKMTETKTLEEKAKEAKFPLLFEAIDRESFNISLIILNGELEVMPREIIQGQTYYFLDREGKQMVRTNPIDFTIEATDYIDKRLVTALREEIYGGRA